ncbi:MAG: rhodanese-like domain-containing protein, partial [Candidatus Kapaibacteriota bacterium]
NLLQKPKIVADTLLERLLSDTTNAIPHSSNDTVRSFVKPDSIISQIEGDKIAAKPSDLASIESRNPDTKSTHVIDELPTVTYNQLKKFLKSPNLILIDARSPSDFEKAHIGNAINIFAYEENLDVYFRNLMSIPFDEKKVIIVYCDGGSCDASHKVAKDLIQLGHKNVFVYAAGWEEWVKKERENE